jgi:hypothetical protein
MGHKQNVPDFLPFEAQGTSTFSADGFERVEEELSASCSQLVDSHFHHGVHVCYLRVNSKDAPTRIRIASTGTVRRNSQGNEFGTLLRINREGSQYTIWLPPSSGRFRFDKHDRIAASCNSPLSYHWDFHPQLQLSVLEPDHQGEVAVVPYVVFVDPHDLFFEELSSLSDIERRLYRKSYWYSARTPSHVWNYLINGSIYDPRSDGIVGKRFKCQQCAYAWWTYFAFLHKKTGKKVYSAMQDEIAFSVLLDMSANGQWKHGFRSDEVETHARFHLDGLHLLISQYHKTTAPMWLKAAEQGMNFIFEHLTEQLDDGGVWFLHDTIEHNRGHHFQSTLFGKGIGNSLCINTHVQAMTVLYRLHQIFTDKEIYAKNFEKASMALRRVLELQTGELFYRPLNSWVRKYSRRRSKAQSTWHKCFAGLEGRIVRNIYWTVRRHFPRIAQSDGFLERDLTRSFAPHWYHITNMKDFLTLYQLKPLPWLRPYIEKGIAFIWRFYDQFGLRHALASSPYHIEIIDILDLSDRLIAPVPSHKIESVKETIFEETGGYSLDYYASELVRGFFNDLKPRSL